MSWCRPKQPHPWLLGSTVDDHNMTAGAFLTRGTHATAGGKRAARKGGSAMAEVVIGIAASHAPNLAIPSLVGKVDEGQQKRVMAGFGEARKLLEQARPDAIVIFSTDHFDRCFYDNLPPFLVGVGKEAEGPINEWLRMPKVKLQVVGELGRFIVSEGLQNGVDFALSEELPLDHAEVVPLSYITPQWNIPLVPIVVNAFAPPMPSLKRCWQVGAFIRAVVKRWPQPKRVAVIG